jgi:hypothetical protein
VLLSLAGQLPTYGSRHKEYEDNGSRDPKRAIEVRIALQHIKEICARVQRRPTSFYHFIGVNVEVLGIEGDGP